MTFRSDSTPLDRAGGVARLRGIALLLVGHDWRLDVVDVGGPRPITAIVVLRDDRPYDTLEEVSTGSSAAIRGDQARDLVEDARALTEILGAEVRRLESRKGAHR